MNATHVVVIESICWHCPKNHRPNLREARRWIDVAACRLAPLQDRLDDATIFRLQAAPEELYDISNAETTHRKRHTQGPVVTALLGPCGTMVLYSSSSQTLSLLKIMAHEIADALRAARSATVVSRARRENIL